MNIRACVCVCMFRGELGLKGVERSLLLLQSDVLLVIDTIYQEAGSPARQVGVYFQNIEQQYEQHRHDSYNGE